MQDTQTFTETDPILDTPLDAAAPAGLSPVTDRWHITDRDGIAWYLRKVHAREAEKALIVAQAEKMVAAIDADIANLHHLYHAEAVAVARQALNPTGQKWTRKTFDTLFGSISFRDVPGGLRRASGPEAQTPEALEKARQIGAVVTLVDGEAYLKAATEALEATGELWPGIETYPARESISVKFGDVKPKARKGSAPA